MDDKIWIFTSYLAGGQKKLSVIWLHLINYWSPSTNVTLFLCKHPHLLCLLEQDSVLLLTWEGQCEKKRILVTDSCANVITCIKPLLDCASPLMIPFCHDFRLCEMNFFLTWDERPVADCSSGEECQKKSVKSQDGTGSRSIINKPWRGTADAGKSKHLLFFHKWFQRCCQASVSMITPWLLSQQQHFADYFLIFGHQAVLPAASSFLLSSHHDVQECGRSAEWAPSKASKSHLHRCVVTCPPVLTATDTWAPSSWWSMASITRCEASDSRNWRDDGLMVSGNLSRLPRSRCQFIAVLNRRAGTLDFLSRKRCASKKGGSSCCCWWLKVSLSFTWSACQMVEQHLKPPHHKRFQHQNWDHFWNLWNQQSWSLHTVIGQLCRGGRGMRFCTRVHYDFLPGKTVWF